MGEKDMLGEKENVALDEFGQELIRVIENHHPKTLGKAIEIVCVRLADCDDEPLVDRILRLESQGKILLENPLAVVPSSLTGFFLSGWASWFWAVFVSAVATSIMVFVVPENAFPYVYVRYVFGSVFVLFLPGHSLIRALLGNGELDRIERLALSIGLSLALVPLVGLLLNYTPWGIRTTPIILSLLALTLVSAFAAVARDFGIKKPS